MLVAAAFAASAVVEVTALLLLIRFLLNIDVGVLPLSNMEILPQLLEGTKGWWRCLRLDLVVFDSFRFDFWFLAVFCTVGHPRTYFPK